MNPGFNPMTAGWSLLNVLSELISFLGLAAFIAGLVVCIIYRNVSKSMILCIVGFAGHIGLYVLDHLVGGLGGFGMGQEAFMAFQYFRTFINLLGPLSTGLLAFGLFRVFSDIQDRRRPRRDEARRPPRRRDEEEEEEERPAPRPKKPGDRGAQR